MKKVLLIGFILVILLLAFPQGVMAADDTGSATVSATISDYITLHVDTPTAWVLSFTANGCGGDDACNQKDDAISGTVHSSDDWTLATVAHATGKMATSAVALQNNLLIETDPSVAAGYSDLTAARTLETGTGGLTVGEPFANNLRQTLDIQDRSDIGEYSITIQLAATTAA